MRSLDGRLGELFQICLCDHAGAKRGQGSDAPESLANPQDAWSRPFQPSRFWGDRPLAQPRVHRGQGSDFIRSLEAHGNQVIAGKDLVTANNVKKAICQLCNSSGKSMQSFAYRLRALVDWHAFLFIISLTVNDVCCPSFFRSFFVFGYIRAAYMNQSACNLACRYAA